MLVFQRLGHQILLCLQGERVGSLGLEPSKVSDCLPQDLGEHEFSGWPGLRLASQGILKTPLGGLLMGLLHGIWDRTGKRTCRERLTGIWTLPNLK